MQLILKEDVRDLGRSGEIVTVAEGYGRNYLLPRKLAVVATPGNLKDLHKRISAAKERETRERADAEQVLERIRATRITLTGRAAEGSTRLHGSITAEQIAGVLTQMLGQSFDKRNVELKNPIRSLGTHQVNIKVLKGMAAPVTVEVLDAAEVEAQAAAAAAAPPAAAAAAAAPAPAAAPAAALAAVEPPAAPAAPAAEAVVAPVEADEAAAPEPAPVAEEAEPA